MTAIAMAYEEGTFASRPSAVGRNGYVYFATDTANLYHSDGSAWTQIAAVTSGGAVSSVFGRTGAVVAVT